MLMVHILMWTLGTKWNSEHSTSLQNHIIALMEKLLFKIDPRSIGVMVESDEGDGVETYLPVLMFNYKITG